MQPVQQALRVLMELMELMEQMVQTALTEQLRLLLLERSRLALLVLVPPLRTVELRQLQLLHYLFMLEVLLQVHMVEH